MIDGVPSRPFSAITLPPILKPEISYAGEIIEYSRKAYGTPRAEVEKVIAKATGVEEVFLEESRDMFDAICVNCGKEIKVPFSPDPTRPVYCKDCFAKMKQKHPKVSSGWKPKTALDKPSYSAKRADAEGKKQRKNVDMEGLKKILEETFPKNK